MKDSIGRARRQSQSAGRDLPSKDAPNTGKKLPQVPPDTLGDYGKWWYTRAAQALNAMGIGDAVDADAVEAAADTYQEFMEAKEHVAEHGAVQECTDAQGNVFFRRNPASNIVQRAREVLRLFRGDLGLTPAARAKFGVGGEPQEDDPFEALMK